MININRSFVSLHQRGSVLVGIILVVLVASIMATAIVETVTTNQRVVANAFNETDAFEAADGGIEYGLMYGKSNIATIITDSDNDGYIDGFSYEALFPTGSRYRVTCTNPIINNFNLLILKSIGTSADGTTTETLSQSVYRSNYLTLIPPAPLTSLGTVTLGGSVGVSNPNQTAIWAGGAVSTGNAVSLTGAVKKNDTNLSVLSKDQFFNNFFNKTKTAAQSGADLVFNNTTNTNYSGTYLTDANGLNGVTGKVIYIKQTAGTTATINSKAVIGSAQNPVIMIVEGDFKFNGGATIYGVVYVIGNWSNSGGGSALLNGAAIVEGNMSSTGTTDLDFSSSVSNLSNITTLVKIPGSWRDF